MNPIWKLESSVNEFRALATVIGVRGREFLSGSSTDQLDRIPNAPGQRTPRRVQRGMGNRKNLPQHAQPNPALGLSGANFTEKILRRGYNLNKTLQNGVGNTEIAGGGWIGI